VGRYGQLCWTKREPCYNVSIPQSSAKIVSDIVECFKLFFSKDFIQHIVQETNRYAQQYQNLRGNLFSFYSPVRSWCPIADNEMYVVRGLLMLTGIIHNLPQGGISQNEGSCRYQAVVILLREWFDLICRFLHFSDNDSKSIYTSIRNSLKGFWMLQCWIPS
jgi:hypothetical protein